MPFVKLDGGTYVPAPWESKAEYRTLRDTIDRYILARHSKETLDSFKEMIVKINQVINVDSAFVGSDYISPVPDEVQERTKHFHKSAKKRMFVASWIDSFDNSDFNLMVEKFYSTSEFDSNDDVWRVTGPDYNVCFVATRQGFGGAEHARILQVPHEMLRTGEPDQWGYYRPPSRHIHTATLFTVSGDIEGLHRDALQWKFSR